MAKVKVENKLFSVLIEAVRIYALNFLQFTKYMLFPVFGQVLGMGLILALASVYSAKLPELMAKYEAFNEFSTIFACVILITVPGMVIFLKAFWDFLVAYGALNSMAESALNTGKVYDFPAHNAVVTNRTFKFVGLWFVISLMLSLTAIPLLFWVPAGILFIYFILVFQVFTFEQDVSVSECFKRSFQLIKGNFARTFVLMAIIALFTHYLFVEGFSVFFDLTKISQLLGGIFEPWVMKNIPLDDFNNFMININPKFDILTPAKISGMFIYQIAFFIVTGITLPLRSICWTLWYKALGGGAVSLSNAKKSKTSGTKKLDKNIIKRATQKEEDL